MKISVDNTRKMSGTRAATRGAEIIRAALAKRGEARIILATGASQFDMLEALAVEENIDWANCTVFHLDEYVGLSPEHPASFVNYLYQRFVELVPRLQHFEAINGAAPKIENEIARLNAIIATGPVDVAFIGIGENGHLAFNDPPADFTTGTPYLKVKLDQACREQQVSEGWFDDLDDVPTDAITMSISQILKSEAIICTVPDARKAAAVYGAVEGPYSNYCPASALQKHQNTWLYLDAPAAAGLKNVASDV